jgi:hypothetical protein
MPPLMCDGRPQIVTDGDQFGGAEAHCRAGKRTSVDAGVLPEVVKVGIRWVEIVTRAERPDLHGAAT